MAARHGVAGQEMGDDENRFGGIAFGRFFQLRFQFPDQIVGIPHRLVEIDVLGQRDEIIAVDHGVERIVDRLFQGFGELTVELLRPDLVAAVIERKVIMIACVLIVTGYLLMAGPGSTEQHFESDIFSTQRIVVAPMLCLVGYLLIVVAILKKG